MNSPNDQLPTSAPELFRTPDKTKQFTGLLLVSLVLVAVAFFMGTTNGLALASTAITKSLSVACSMPRAIVSPMTETSSRVNGSHVTLQVSLTPDYGNSCDIQVASHTDHGTTAVEINTGKGYADSGTEVSRSYPDGGSFVTAYLDYSKTFEVRVHVTAQDGSAVTFTKSFGVFVDGTGRPAVKVIPVHSIGALGFSGDGQIAEHVTVEGVNAEVEATLQGSVLTTVSSSAYGSYRTVQTIERTSTPLALTVPTDGDPLTLTTEVVVRNE